MNQEINFLAVVDLDGRFELIANQSLSASTSSLLL
jgi:hypothetical protein